MWFINPFETADFNILNITRYFSLPLKRFYFLKYIIDISYYRKFIL